MFSTVFLGARTELGDVETTAELALLPVTTMAARESACAASNFSFRLSTAEVRRVRAEIGG